MQIILRLRMMDQDPGRLRIEDFQYELPEERIALYPLENRERAKLLSYRAGNLSDHVFADLPAVLPKGVQLLLSLHS